MTLSNPLAVTAHEGYLADTEVDRLITIAQHVPYDAVADSYGTTPEADAALEILTKAFLPVIHKVARTSTVLQEEDALMFCLEEFLVAVREYVTNSALPFKAGLRVRLSRKLGDLGRTSGLIVVRENAAARYRQIMDRHDWNLEAAYAECKAETNGFAPDTFLAVHNSLGVDSLDVSAVGDPSTGAFGGSNTSGVADQSQHRDHLADPDPSPEAVTVQADTIRYLFQQVEPASERVLRLAYGFGDLATENARLAAGFRADGSPMSDREVGVVVGSSGSTVNRRRLAALAVMREALTDEDDEVPTA